MVWSLYLLTQLNTLVSTTTFLIVPVVYLGLLLDARVWFYFSFLFSYKKRNRTNCWVLFFCLLG